MTTNSNNEQAIFVAAIEKSNSAERAAFLEAACGADRQLRARLDELLQAHDQTHGPFDARHGALASNSDAAHERTGQMIGPYKLLQEIGEGGMGVVYMAEQTRPIQRRVALKIIKPGMDSRQVIARFEAERQALALMDHPNIAKVLDAGTTEAGSTEQGAWSTNDALLPAPSSQLPASSGRPYFVMELVQGAPITKFCDQHRLTPRERFELFLPVCQAVHHAHQKGIVHRDLKPSNILVTLYDGRPLPKIIDFGVAKATQQRLTEKTLFTEFGHVVGTLEYMSPEQARLDHWDVDTRSDIYSLGVLLYELLVGETPFDGQRLRAAAFDDMLRIIREEDPPTPSRRLSDSASLPAIAANRQMEPGRLTSAIRGEPDWIVMKALDKDRTRRYESAASLADDITRLLNDEPVKACPPTRRYRMQKFVRRHKAWLATLGLVAAALLVGLVTTTWQAIVARGQRDDAITARANEADQRRLADAARREAERSLVDLYEARGIDHNDHGEMADAALWFASAAALCNPSDTARRDANLVRSTTFRLSAPFPVRAFYQPLLLPNLQFDPSGRYLVGHNGDMGGETRLPPNDRDFWKVWEVETERALPLPFAESDITSLAWSPDGNQIAIASATKDMLLADFPSVDNRYSVPDTVGARALSFSPDGKHLAYGRGSQVAIWNVPERSLEESPMKHPKEVRYIAWSPDSSRILTASGFEARVFAVPSSTGFPLFPAVRHVMGHRIIDRSAVWPMFAYDGKQIITLDTHVRWRDSFTGEVHASSEIQNEMSSLEGREEPVKEGLSAITLSWDGVGVKTAVFSPSQALVKSITPKDSNPNSDPVEMVFFHPTRGVTSLLHSPGGGFFLASGSEQGLVTLETNFDTRVIRHITSVTSIAFAPNRPLLATAQRDGLIRIWDLANAVLAGKGLPVSGQSFAAISPDGKYVVSTGHSLKFARPRECAVYTTADGEAATKHPLIPGGQVVDAQFSVDSNRLAIACSEPHEISLWNWREPKSLARSPLPADPRGIDFGPDEQVAVLCGDAMLLVVDGSTGAVRNQWKTAAFGSLISPVNNGRVQFLPDGQSLVTYGHVAEVWNVATGERRFRIEHGERCHDIALSPDGTLLATADFNGTARIWDLNTGRAVTPELTHPAWVYTVRFSPDGQQLLTGCADGMVRLWDWRKAELAVAPMRHDGQVFAAEFIRDGQWIFALSDDNRFCLWDSTTGRPLTPRILRYANQGPSSALYLTPDGTRAVLTGFPALALYDLTTVPSDLGSPQEAILRAEILAGRTIQSGSTVNLTSDEWLRRWKRYGPLMPITAVSHKDEVRTPEP